MPSVAPTYYDPDDVYSSMDDVLSALEATVVAITAGGTARAATGETAHALRHVYFLYAEMLGEWLKWSLVATSYGARFASYPDIVTYLNTSDQPETRWRPASLGGKAKFTAIKNWALLDGSRTSVGILAECGERAGAQMDEEGGTNDIAYTNATRALLATLPAL